MKCSKRKAEFLEKAIVRWEQEGTIDEKEAEKLRSAIEVVSFDWKQFAQYSFWIAVVCFVIAVGALVADEILMEVITDLLNRIFYAPDRIKSLTFLAVAAAFFGWGLKRHHQKPHLVYSNEIFYLMGVFSTLIAMLFLYSSFNFDGEYLSTMLAGLTITYMAVAIFCESRLVWVFALLAMGSWIVAVTGYRNGWEPYFMGMNYPFRFVLFGLMVVLLGKIFSRVEWVQKLELSTHIIGLWYFFTALWLLSIFGNYSQFTEWYDVPQQQLVGWAVLQGVVSLLSIIYGLRFHDSIAHKFGITFLLLGLYTRYVEYLWESLHMAAFFAILAISFWLIGTKAEKIWYLGANSNLAKNEE